MGFENFDVTPEITPEVNDAKAGSFQNPVWADIAWNDLMPQIQFTTDQAEAQEAAEADRSNPFDLPDAVFYVEPKGETAGDGSADVPAASGEYAGPSPEMLRLQIESDMKHLTFAKEQMEEAIERGTSVIEAMRNVESAQAVLDARMKLYSAATAFHAQEVSTVAETGEDEIGETAVGNVSHAEWRLEKAYESGSQADINSAKKYMAQEMAKEEKKNMEN